MVTLYRESLILRRPCLYPRVLFTDSDLLLLNHVVRKEMYIAFSPFSKLR